MTDQTQSYVSTPNTYIMVNDQRIAIREVGTHHAGIPLVMLNHLAATMDEWDPKLVDLLAQRNHVIVMDLPGVGASAGNIGRTIPEMAQQAIAIIRTLGHQSINLLGLSMGGMIAQEIVRAQPQLVQHLMLAGTGPRGGLEVNRVTGKTFKFMLKGLISREDPKRFIFYNHDDAGRAAAHEVLDRMAQRPAELRGKAMNVPGFLQQLRAIRRWGDAPRDDLAYITQPTLVVNGDNDLQVPTQNSYDMHRQIAGSTLVIYPNAGHGAIFQHADAFAVEVERFLKQ